MSKDFRGAHLSRISNCGSLCVVRMVNMWRMLI